MYVIFYYQEKEKPKHVLYEQLLHFSFVRVCSRDLLFGIFMIVQNG